MTPSQLSSHSPELPAWPADFSQSLRRLGVAELLRRHGWECLDDLGDCSLWCHPGLPDARVTLYRLEGRQELLHVHERPTPPFVSGRSYTPLAVLALLEHGGDFRAAGRALAGSVTAAANPPAA